MQHSIRKSNAGLVLWGDIYVLKALWTFIHRVIEESALLKIEDPLLSGLAYEVRHAFDGMRKKNSHEVPWLPLHAATPTVFILHGYPHLPRQTSGGRDL